MKKKKGINICETFRHLPKSRLEAREIYFMRLRFIRSLSLSLSLFFFYSSGSESKFIPFSVRGGLMKIKTS
jgi:hypothetical protein